VELVQFSGTHFTKLHGINSKSNDHEFEVDLYRVRQIFFSHGLWIKGKIEDIAED